MHHDQPRRPVGTGLGRVATVGIVTAAAACSAVLAFALPLAGLPGSAAASRGSSVASVGTLLASKTVVTTTTTTTHPPTTTTTTNPPTTTTTTNPPTTSTPPLVASTPTIASDCSVDVSAVLTAYLASLPSRSVFTSPPGACYLVNEGVQITHPVSLDGGTFRDDSTTHPAANLGELRPVIRIFDTTGVTLSNLTAVGANTVGAFHSSLVTEAGVKIVSSSHVTITNVTTVNTFGDGLELVADLTNHITTPVTGLLVNGFTTVNAGRQGITLAEVNGATFDNVQIISPADSGFDFESDLPKLGSGNVTVTGCTYQHGVNMVELLTGPVSFHNCTGTSFVTLGSPESPQPVTFTGGSLACFEADPHPCITQRGGNLTFSHMAVNRHKLGVRTTEPIWSVTMDGHLTFDTTSVEVPFGTVASGSTLQRVG